MQGTIENIVNGGTVVQVLVRTEDRLVPINFDHRPFSWLLEAEGGVCGSLIGREIFYDEEKKTVRFLDHEGGD
jgi:hypothetical protein